MRATLPPRSANASREHESEPARSAGNDDDFVAQRIACGANDARDQPCEQEESACQQQNAKIHFDVLQSSTESFAARY